MKRLPLKPLLFLVAGCLSSRPGTAAAESPPAFRGLPQIINVSAYDPTERQREGRSYSVNDVSPLRANGACALIARAGKGGNLDEKCASFLTAADRAGMLPGVYYRLQTHVDAVKQADQFVDRARALASARSWSAPALLLCGDFDAKSRLSDILLFVDRVEARTKVVPVVYLENSAHLKILLQNAADSAKAKLRRAPYWLALYSHDGGGDAGFPPPGNPQGLLEQYRVWPDWALWQYGGVDWERGRSRPKVYNHGSWSFSRWFGNLDRPVERNVFNGSHSALQTFWQRHGLPLR